MLSLKAFPNPVPPGAGELSFLRSRPSVVASENWALRKERKWDAPGASESVSGDRAVCSGDVIPGELSAARPWPRGQCQFHLSTLLNYYVRTFYRRLATSTNAYHKQQNELLSQSFISFQFLPFSPGTSLNQLEQFASLGCCKNCYLLFSKRRPKLSENVPMEIHCNIRNNKGVLSYTTFINKRGEYKQNNAPVIILCV